MTGNEIRKIFIDFFEKNDHTHVDSSGLIPQNDPTLLFINAGMAQFKSVFLGDEQRPYTRAVTSQKCVRAGGKHNDLENVGRTARHHTFFEMLGNFSFGDYFKEKAIPMAWDLVTKEYGLPEDKLLVTVYSEDDEAYDIWHKTVGLPKEKIIRISTSDNFWSMGNTGPCGPCSEIFYDNGDHIDGGPPGSENEDGDRFVEIWNLVFMQYNRDEAGTLHPLPSPCIDTGAGLERITAILQGKTNNYDSDLFQPLIQNAAKICGKPYGETDAHDVSLRVIADHIRAVSFLIADGVLPSNEGRGYVLRRIMRRAMRHGRLLGMKQPFLYKLVATLTALMGETYPELSAQQKLLAMIIENEEKRFITTLDAGLKILEDAVADFEEGDVVDGKTVFTLYDTFGFPVDLTADITRDRGITLDLEGFEAHMAEQRARARAAWAGSGDEAVSGLYHELLDQHGATEFMGYVTESAHGALQAILKDGSPVDKIEKGDKAQLIVNQTPFYGESGGQVGDAGIITTDSAKFIVSDTQKPLPGLTVHHGRVANGSLAINDPLTLDVDHEWRSGVRMHHSATHYLHHALRSVIGDHVKQAGSLVESARLRFDFNHFQGMTHEEVTEVENRVNAAILDNERQQTTVMTPEEAVEAGAMALFGEKYGDEVRVVRMGPTMELCGGTHVNRSGDIGIFRIISESAVAAGVRRIEAVCGPEARRSFQQESAVLRQAAQMLKAQPHALTQGIERLLNRQKELEKELEKAKSAMSGNLVDELLDKKSAINGVDVIAEIITDQDPKGLRDLIDRLKDKLGSGLIFLAMGNAGKVNLIAGVTKDLIGRFRAGDIIKHAAPIVGGRGGGRPDMAQGGGSQPENMAEAMNVVKVWVADQ
ncbi:MAG: alanine--tRNA ligase [Magnetococcales bacterium]|nr:alanine--tRNA ligase [Magnetococcales bacterium]